MHLLNQLWSLQQSVQDLKVIMSDRSSIDMDLGSPQSETWEQTEEYMRYLHRLGFATSAVLQTNLDAVNESETVSSSSTSSISSSRSNSEKI